MRRIEHLVSQIKKSDIGFRIANGAIWSFTGTSIAKLLVLVSSIFCAHILTKQEYGELGMVRSTINMFVVFGSAGLGLTATKYISEFRDKNKEKIASVYLLTNGFAFITGLVVAIIVLITAPSLATNTLHTPHLLRPIRIGAILLFITILNGAQNGVLSGFEDFKSIAINTFIGSFAEAILLLVGAYYGGVAGAILGYGVSFIVLFIANFITIQKDFKIRGIKVSYSMLSKEDLSILYKFSLPAALCAIIVAPTLWIAKTMLTNNNGFDELAIYEAADQWRIIILFVPTAVSQVVLPILSNVIGVDKTKFWKVLRTNLILNTSLATLIALLVSLSSPLIMRLYGGGYESDYLVLIILACSTIFSVTANVVGMAISSRSKMWEGFLFNLFWVIMVLAFARLFIKIGLGAAGLALAYTLAYFIHTFIQLVYLRIVSNRG